MAPNALPQIIVIVGPTASGKSALSVKLAKNLGGEVVSADSRQIYRGLDIGTCKITKREMYGVRHWLLDVASPKRQFSVTQYVKLARKAIADILRRGKLPIICGGTGQYIDALLYDSKIPEVPPNLKLRKRLEELSTDKLFSMLRKLDPARTKTIDRHNPRRLVRAIEIVKATGKPVPALQHAIPRYNAMLVGLNPGKAELQKRIASRLKRDLWKGLIKEVSRLRKQGLSLKRLNELGLEYRLVDQYLRGKFGKSALIQKLNVELWRYAKRQMTWFKRNKNIQWTENPKVRRLFKKIRGLAEA